MSPTQQIAVLLGGGIESTLIVKRYLTAGYEVVPIHIDCGLIWDQAESENARKFCEMLACEFLRPLEMIRISLRETFPDHWAVTGRDVPMAGADSAKLEIPLRNLTLLGLATHAIRDRRDISLALGTTIENNYRDGSREYFDRCEQVFSIERGETTKILTPLITWQKTDVIQRSDQALLAASFSCVSPAQGQHCGKCIKCGKRRESFIEAGVTDPTTYIATEKGAGLISGRNAVRSISQPSQPTEVRKNNET